jgi:sortase A
MKILSYAVTALGLLSLAYWAVELGRGRLYQVHESRHFSERLPESHPAGVLFRPSAGSAIAMLAIPRLGLSAVVVEGAGERELRLGPGHIRGTSLPGDGGNVGIAGHRDTFFRPLRFIRRNDTIKVTTHDQIRRYEVISTEIVSPDETRVLRPTGRETLTLVTCYPFNFVGSAPKRFIVRAVCSDCS